MDHTPSPDIIETPQLSPENIKYPVLFGSPEYLLLSLKKSSPPSGHNPSEDKATSLDSPELHSQSANASEEKDRDTPATCSKSSVFKRLNMTIDSMEECETSDAANFVTPSPLTRGKKRKRDQVAAVAARLSETSAMDSMMLIADCAADADDEECDTAKTTAKRSKRRRGADASERPSRYDTSLGLLTSKFIDIITVAPGANVNLNDIALALGVQKRRVYDITNVLDGLGMTHKQRKNRIQWNDLGVTMTEEQRAELKRKVTVLEADVEHLKRQEEDLDMHIGNSTAAIAALLRDTRANVEFGHIVSLGYLAAASRANDTVLAVSGISSKAPNAIACKVGTSLDSLRLKNPKGMNPPHLLRCRGGVCFQVTSVPTVAAQDVVMRDDGESDRDDESEDISGVLLSLAASPSPARQLESVKVCRKRKAVAKKAKTANVKATTTAGTRGRVVQHPSPFTAPPSLPLTPLKTEMDLICSPFSLASTSNLLFSPPQQFTTTLQPCFALETPDKDRAGKCLWSPAAEVPGVFKYDS